jgi:hypothetical protein
MAVLRANRASGAAVSGCRGARSVNPVKSAQPAPPADRTSISRKRGDASNWPPKSSMAVKRPCSTVTPSRHCAAPICDPPAAASNNRNRKSCKPFAGAGPWCSTPW